MAHVVQDPVEYIRQRPQMFLRSGRVSGQALAESIAGDSLTLTGGPVTVFRRGDWWFVGCEEDWMALPSGPSVDELFCRIVAFPEAGPNAMHSEILLTAFARDVLLKEGGTLRALKGSMPEADEARGTLLRDPRWQRAVAFRVAS